MLRARTAKKDFTALPLTECLAKTYRNAHDVTAAGRTVLDHALITGAVAALLLERLPKCTLPFYPEGVDRIVSAHDVGKVCPTFQHKIHQAAGSLGTFPELADADPSLEQDWRGHASISFAALKAVQGNVFIPQIVGRHHGVPPKKATRLRATPMAATHGKNGVRNCSPSSWENEAGLTCRQRHRHCS